MGITTSSHFSVLWFVGVGVIEKKKKGPIFGNCPSHRVRALQVVKHV